MSYILLSLMLVGELNPNVGTTGYNFLKIPPTAREAAMGNTGIGLSDHAFALWYNPAGLGAISQRQLGASYISYLAGVNSGAVAFATPRPIGLGLGIYYVNGGTMSRIDENQIPLGTFTPSCLDFNVAGGTRLAARLALGLGVKALYTGIDTFFALGLAANIGASFDLPVSGLSASLVARNLGITLKPMIDTAERLPMEVALGFGYRAGTLNLALEAVIPSDNQVAVRAGLDWWLFKYVAVRGGLTTAGSDLKAGTGGDILAGLSTGLGIRSPVRQVPIEVDYSFTPMVLLGNVHRVSVRYTLP
ncbi:MAG: PorV/PorQ family protein [candidate division WOR-3 bacterium]